MKSRIKKEDIDKHDLEYLVNERCLPNTETAKILCCSVEFIRTCVKHYGINTPSVSKRIKSQYKNGRKVNCKIYDIPLKEDLEFLYNEKKMSLNKMKDVFSTSIPTLKKWMKEYDIDIRGLNESQKLIKVDTLSKSANQIGLYAYICINNKQWMVDAYKYYSSEELSKILNVSLGTIYNYLKKFSIRCSESDKWEKVSSTNRKKYGVCNPFQSEEIKKKIRNTNIDKYGVENVSMQFISDDTMYVLNNYEELEKLYNKYPSQKVADILCVAKSTVLNYLIKHGIERNMHICSSSPEQEIKEYIESISDTKIIQGDRKIISPLEIDLYLPKHNLAIEYNGIYWHSEQQGKKRNYHLDKTKACENKKIHLLHIFENEWIDPIKQHIWKSVIANKLGIYQTKIGARQTEIREVPNKEVNVFLENNHLQGKCVSLIKYGLYYDDELVSLMTFGKSRFSRTDWELIRFCSKLDYQVYGAASKLLNHFKKHHNGSIISYANRRWSMGDLYKKIGFDFLHNSSSNYFYWKTVNLLESRNKYQKHKLASILEHFDENVSEYQNMLNNGYDRIWDCGNKVYILS